MMQPRSLLHRGREHYVGYLLIPITVHSYKGFYDDILLDGVDGSQVAIVPAWQLHDDEAHHGAGWKLVCIQQAQPTQRRKTSEHYRGPGCGYVQVVNLLHTIQTAGLCCCAVCTITCWCNRIIA